MVPERELAEHVVAVSADSALDEAVERAKYLLLVHLSIAIRSSDDAISNRSVRDVA